MNIKLNLWKYIVGIILVGFFAYVTVDSGVFNDITTGNYQNIIFDYTHYNVAKNIPGTNVNPKHGVQHLGNISYIKTNIPPKVLNAAANTYMWDSIFKSKYSKTVFFVDDANSPLNVSVRNYVANLAAYGYTVQSFDKALYKQNSTNFDKPSSYCNSFEECKKANEHASMITTLTGFMDRCARNVCIINIRTKEYIMIHSKNPNDVNKVIYQNAGW